jgi:hypothetical protein
MRVFLFLIAGLLGQLYVQAQLLSVSPQFIQENSSPVEITVNALKGNQGLKDYSGTGMYMST